MSEAIGRKFCSMPEYISSRCIMSYATFGREVDTAPIITNALASGKTVCIPKTLWNQKIIKPVTLKRIEDIDFTGMIPQPRKGKNVKKTDIDIVIVPGIVFDASGDRLGFGAGFYDRFLEDFGKLKVALAFDFQVADEKLPDEKWDVPVDMIITEKRILRCRFSTVS